MTTLNRSIVPSILACLLIAPWAAAQGYPPPQPAGTAGAAGMSAGGLAPPTPMGTTPGQATPGYQGPTEAQLRKAEQKDSGRELEWFYLNAEGGFQALGLQTLSSKNLAYGSTSTTAMGPMVGAGLGARLMFITIGARARMGIFDQYKATTLNAEFGWHLPLGSIEPYFTLGAGYAFLSSLEAARWGSADAKVRGVDVRGGFGLDYYVTPVFSIGGNLTGDLLFLSRPAVKLDSAATKPGGLDTAAQKTAMTDGSSVGAAFTGSVVVGLHF